MGLKLPPVGSLRAADLDHILQQVRDTDQAGLVNELILRAQNQAEYSPNQSGILACPWPPMPISPARSAVMPTC